MSTLSRKPPCCWGYHLPLFLICWLFDLIDLLALFGVRVYAGIILHQAGVSSNKAILLMPVVDFYFHIGISSSRKAPNWTVASPLPNL